MLRLLYVLKSPMVMTGESAFLTFSGIVCDDMNNMDPTDDVIRFTVTGGNGNSSQSLSGWPEYPPTAITMPNNLNFSDMTMELDFWYSNDAFSVEIEAGSDGCAPLNLMLDWGNNDCELVPVTLAPFAAPIPTLSQWGIIVLSMMLLIVGVLFFKVSEWEFTS